MIKAACHIHSDWSYDGKLSLQNLTAEFEHRGYGVLLMTEHDRGFTQARFLDYRKACAEVSTAHILVVPGIEYSDAGNVVHVLVWGDVPFFGEGLPTLELLERVEAAGGIAVMAHPTRKEAWTRFGAYATKLLGIEIWNRKTDGWAPSQHAFSLLKGTSLLPWVGLDFHSARQFFPLAAYLDLDRPVSEASVLACLTGHRFRSVAFGREVGPNDLNGWWLFGFAAAERCRRFIASTCRLFRYG